MRDSLCVSFPAKGWTKRRKVHVNKRRFAIDISDLKQRVKDTRGSIPQSIINKAVDQWRTRLRACVKIKGHHFEHML